MAMVRGSVHMSAMAAHRSVATTTKLYARARAHVRPIRKAYHWSIHTSIYTMSLSLTSMSMSMSMSMSPHLSHVRSRAQPCSDLPCACSSAPRRRRRRRRVLPKRISISIRRCCQQRCLSLCPQRLIRIHEMRALCKTPILAHASPC